MNQQEHFSNLLNTYYGYVISVADGNFKAAKAHLGYELGENPGFLPDPRIVKLLEEFNKQLASQYFPVGDLKKQVEELATELANVREDYRHYLLRSMKERLRRPYPQPGSSST